MIMSTYPGHTMPSQKLHVVPSSAGHPDYSSVSTPQSTTGAISSPNGHLLTPISGMSYNNAAYVWPPQSSTSSSSSYSAFPQTPSSYSHQSHYPRATTGQLYSPISDTGIGSSVAPGQEAGSMLGGSSESYYDFAAGSMPSTHCAVSNVGVPLSNLNRPRSNNNLQTTHPSPSHSSPSDLQFSRSGFYQQPAPITNSYASSVTPPHMNTYSGNNNSRSFNYPVGNALPNHHNSSFTHMGGSSGVLMSPYSPASHIPLGHQFPSMFGPQQAQQSSQDRPYKCNECPQSFNRNHDLKRHKRIHLDVKPFPCNHCEKSFSRKDALKRHILVKGCGKNAAASGETSNVRDSVPASTSSNEAAPSPSATSASTTVPGSSGRVPNSRERMSGTPGYGSAVGSPYPHPSSVVGTDVSVPSPPQHPHPHQQHPHHGQPAMSTGFSTFSSSSQSGYGVAAPLDPAHGGGGRMNSGSAHTPDGFSIGGYAVPATGHTMAGQVGVSVTGSGPFDHDSIADKVLVSQ